MYFVWPTLRLRQKTKFEFFRVSLPLNYLSNQLGQTDLELLDAVFFCILFAFSCPATDQAGADEEDVHVG